MYTDAEYLSALERMKADFEERSGGATNLTFKETNDIRLHAKSLTDLDSDDLTADQAAWKVLYDSLTEELRRIDPELMAQIEPLEARVDALKAVQGAITAKLEAHPHDYGFRVPLVFLIVGGHVSLSQPFTLAYSTPSGVEKSNGTLFPPWMRTGGVSITLGDGNPFPKNTGEKSSDQRSTSTLPLRRSLLRQCRTVPKRSFQNHPNGTESTCAGRRLQWNYSITNMDNFPYALYYKVHYGCRIVRQSEHEG